MVPLVGNGECLWNNGKSLRILLSRRIRIIMGSECSVIDIFGSYLHLPIPSVSVKRHMFYCFSEGVNTLINEQNFGNFISQRRFALSTCKNDHEILVSNGTDRTYLKYTFRWFLMILVHPPLMISSSSF